VGGLGSGRPHGRRAEAGDLAWWWAARNGRQWLETGETGTPTGGPGATVTGGAVKTV
jgi:hypothetical protein